MTDAGGTSPREAARRWLSEAMDSATMARAFTVVAFGTTLSSFAITRTAGAVTYVTIVAGLCLVGAAMLFRRRREVDFVRLLPLSLILFIVWLLVTVFWSRDKAYSIGGWLAIAAVAFLAIVIVHVRDTLQTARALGDVLRVLLSVSLGLEILSGVLLDMPITFLGITGDIAAGGPVQGIFGTRNMLGFVTVIALITFVIEWRTHSVRPEVAVFSIACAGLLALLSASPTVLALALAVGAATGALAIVRHADPHQRSALQITIGSTVVIGLLLAYAFRGPIITLLNAGRDFSTRGDLWDTIFIYVRTQPVQGHGWFGPWPALEFPFISINAITDAEHSSALNAFLDVLLQTGWIGLLLFAAACAIAVVRSWLVATARRSVVYAWTPLVLAALLVDGIVESFVLFGFGWLLLTICIVRAGMNGSWRERLDRTPPAASIPRA